MKIPNSYYLIIDLEATCSKDNTVPRHEMEIIEIGAVMLNSESLKVESEFQAFVKPVIHKTLTPFCTELTSITQSDVENAPLLAEVIQEMKSWMADFPDALFCSWGEYDRKQFERECRDKRIEYPFHNGHMNLKQEFSKAVNSKKRFGLSGAIEHLKLDFDGTHHRGIDDARNIARIVQTVFHKNNDIES